MSNVECDHGISSETNKKQDDQVQTMRHNLTLMR